MLYDKKWDKHQNPYSLDSLVSWLERQSANTAYNYISCTECLLAQYFTAMGFEDSHIGTAHFKHKEGLNVALPDGFNAIAFEAPHTFGDALKRAHSLQKAMV